MNPDLSPDKAMDHIPESKPPSVQPPSENIESASEQEAGDQTVRFPENPEGLPGAKREYQSFEASGNTGNVQFFINTISMGNEAQYQKVPSLTRQRRDKQKEYYDLSELADCAKFVEKYRNGEYLALAITLAIFDVVTINDLPRIEDNLISFLPDVEVTEDEDMTDNHRSNPYLSLQSKLSVIGAKSFIRNDDQNCVGFGGKSKQILLNIWTQFPALRNAIISWLVDVNRIHAYRTTFDLQQIIGAFSKVISLDFVDAERTLFSKLYSNQKNVFFMGTLACFLLRDPATKEEARRLVLGWAESESQWLWKSALFTYAGLETPEQYDDLKVRLQKRLKRQMNCFSKNDVFLLVKILSCSVHAREMVCEIFYKRLSSTAASQKVKEQTARFYLSLVECSYFCVDKSSPELFFAACDTRQEQKLLSPVIVQTVENRQMRQWLFAILSLYLEEISEYQISNLLVKHMAAYFINMMHSAPTYRYDVIAFLEDCSCSVSESILKLVRI